MTSRLLCVVAAAVVVGMSFSPEAVMARCVPCAFSGFCETNDGGEEFCGPTAAGCVPKSGILVFETFTLPTRVRWKIHAPRRGGQARGVLRGRLRAFVEEAMPGFPPGRCDGGTCESQRARFEGTIFGDRLTATARYPGGATCEFDLSLIHGPGDLAAPNHFVCRKDSGTLLSEGPLDVGLMRLSGCGTP